MFKVYKKVEKTEENQYGIVPIEEGNPFEQPTFLSLLAINETIRHTNGSISRILELAGARTPDGEERIPVSEMPIEFLGLSFSDKINEYGKYERATTVDGPRKIDDDTRDITIRFLLPLLTENGRKRDINECRKNMRNINIMCFCDGLYMVSSMNKVLVEEMTKIGFSQEEITDILSQVCIFPIGTEYGTMSPCLKNMKFTTIFLLDMKDTFYMDDKQLKEIFGDTQEGLFNTQRELTIPAETMNLDSRLIVTSGDGDHDLSSFIKKGTAYPAILMKTVSTILNNSVANNNGQEFVPLTEVINQDLPQICSSLIEAEKKGLSKEEITSLTMENITYPKPISKGINK